MIETNSVITTPCPKKTKQICFCQNFVKFPPILIIFGRKMGNDPNICEVHSFSTSPNLRHHLTLLNADVPNCYITPKLSVIDRSYWRPQSIRGRSTFRDHSTTASGMFCRRKFIAPKLLTSMNSKRVSSTSDGAVRPVNIHAAISQWRRRLSACVRARGAHFEHKF